MTLDSFLSSGTSPGQQHRTCRVAVAGFGHVGSAVARRLTGPESPPGIILTHVFDRRAPEKRRAFRTSALTWTTRFEDLLSSAADVIVETIGGTDSSWIRDALIAGKSVVTANKQVIARDGAALGALAARQGRQLRFEAAVGGAMPIVRAVSDGLAGERITRLTAVLNGTSNAVLSQIDETGCTMEEAVADARSRGWAEADPAGDLDGADARAKLAILCALAFALRVDPRSIDARSTAHIGPAAFERAKARGATIRQIAHAEYDAERSTLAAWVAPALVPRDSLFGRTTGPRNAAIIGGVHAGEIGIFGTGAGGDATAVAVLADVIAIARDRAAVIPVRSLTTPAIVRGVPPGGGIFDGLGGRASSTCPLAEAV